MRQGLAELILGVVVSSAMSSRISSRIREQTHSSKGDVIDLDKVLDEWWPGFRLDWEGSRLSCEYPAYDNCNASKFKAEVDFKNHEQFFNVYPGGETACLDGSPYYFTVRKGDPDKLHIHFQAGGACWGIKKGEDETTSGSLLSDGCRHGVGPQPAEGFAKLNDKENPWTDYTFVIVNYCSGDGHMGHANPRWGNRSAASLEQGEESSAGEIPFFPIPFFPPRRRKTATKPPQQLPPRDEVKVRGIQNALSALKYAKSHFGNADKITVSGSSAGSIGVVPWTRWIVNNFRGTGGKDITVLGDSFLGIMYPYSQRYLETQVFRRWNTCTGVLLAPSVLRRCRAGKLTIAELRDWNLRAYPEVRIATLNAKADIVQILYERAYSADFNNPAGEKMTKGQFYKEANLQVKTYLKQPNYYNFWVQSHMHVLLYTDLTLKLTRTNVVLGPAGVLGTRMVDWLRALIDHKAHPTRNACFGPKRPIEREGLWGFVGLWDDRYCLA